MTNTLISNNISSNIKPLISIGLPVYNGESFLSQAIDSILAQTHDNFELIICDNASTDNTSAICQQYKKDARVRYIRSEENKGAAWNFCNVFALASGEYFKWAAHDDICAPSFLERCLAVLEHDATTILSYPQTIIIDSNGKQICPYDNNLNLDDPQPCQRFSQFLQRPSRECNAVFGLIRSSMLRKTALIKNFCSSDQNLLAHLALMGKFHEIPEALFFRRDHPQTSLRANTTDKEVFLWFDPLNKGKWPLTRLRRFLEYSRCILISNLPWQERIHCFYQLLKRIFRKFY